MQAVTSNLPASFGGNGFLYAGALAALMSISCLGIGVCGWMARDIWRDRFHSHPKSLLFAYRLIFMVIGFTAFLRTCPEVIYLQVYNDPQVSQSFVDVILMIKRSMDIISLGFFAFWLMVFVGSYPHICLTLKHGIVSQIEMDIGSIWPRLIRPSLLFILIVIVSCLTAYAKVYGA